jgi:hypothetical protein
VGFPHTGGELGHLKKVLKNRASGRDPVLCGFYKCSHIMNMLRFPKRRTPGLTA